MVNNDDTFEIIKLGIFGESSVGKTHYARKYVNDVNEDFNLPTIGVECFMKKRILPNGKNYKIKIYDTAGQERYRSISKSSIRNCDGIILMYDITNKVTFKLIGEWIKDIFNIKGEYCPLILIGNKSDLENKREVYEEEGLEEAKKYNSIFFETSAKEGINVENSIEELLKKIIDNKEKNKKKDNNFKIEKKNKNKTKKKKNLC